MSAMALLDVQDLTARYEARNGTVHAVNGVSFQVRESEFVGIVGESGCGKSATVRSVLGLLRPPGRVVSGSVMFDGTDLLHLSRNRMRHIRGNQIGFVAQNPFGALNPILTVEEQFRNVIEAHRGRTGRGEAAAMAEEALVGVGISGPQRVLQGHAHELSGGMAQRVVIALATILAPKLVIADEPTTALDVTLQRQILDLMQTRVVGQGQAALLVTHDLGVVAQYCSRVVVMYAGKVVEEGPVDAVLKDPAHPYTQALLQSVPRRGGSVTPLQGRVANLRDYPRGCPFEPRCAVAVDRCRTDPPELEPVEARGDPVRMVSCHVATEGVRDVAGSR
jgi:oligopeptide/dipeptide ABC transporter ATP-binding protein